MVCKVYKIESGFGTLKNELQIRNHLRIQNTQNDLLNDSYVKQDQEFLIQINNLNNEFDKNFPGIPFKFQN
jgi:hypothetical protein